MIEESTDFALLRKLYKEEDFQGMINYCTAQIDAGNSNHLLFGARGKAFYKIDDLDKAIYDLTKSIEMYPLYAYGLYNRGLCYYDIENYQSAIEDLEKAASLDNSFDEIYYYLGISYFVLQNNIKAIEYFTLHLEDYNDDDALKWRAWSYKAIKEYQKSFFDYERFLIYELNNKELLEQLESINNIDFCKTIENKSTISFASSNIKIELEKINFIVNPQNIIGTDLKSLCGIYILEFDNSEYYIGQAKSLHVRLKQHFKKHKDIKNIYFKEIVETALLEEEDKTIGILERSLIRIRNLKQISFYNLFDRNCQKAWLSNFDYNYNSGIRFNNNEVRESFSDRFKIFSNKPYFEKFISYTSLYIKSCIPNYLASEFSYWTITCLPQFLLKENCISRININEVPVFSMYFNDEGLFDMMLFTSKLSILQYLKNGNRLDNLLNEIKSLRIEVRDTFECTEGDEITLVIEEQDINKALTNELILNSIRQFNLRMMNRSAMEEKYRRSPRHCLDLSDCLFAKMSEM